MKRFEPEQIAAALVRAHNTAKPAAEELLDTGPAPKERKERREDFKNGVWMSLSVGRKHTAEPRWIIPMLCRAGHITNKEIGAIKIQQEETFVELEASCVDKFLEAVGPGGKLEKTVEVKRVSGPPKDTREPRREHRGKEHRGKEHRGKGRGDKERGDGRPRDEEKPGSYPKRKFEGKKRKFSGDDKPRGKFDRNPREFEDDKAPENKKPAGEQKAETHSKKPAKRRDNAEGADKQFGKFNQKPKEKKAKTKKTFEGKLSISGKKNSSSDAPGSGFLKRKKPKKLL